MRTDGAAAAGGGERRTVGMYGTGGISFDVPGSVGGGGEGGNNSDGGHVAVDPSLVYWVFDVPPPRALSPSSGVVGLARDDDADGLNVLWIQRVDGIIEGTPVIG